MKKPHEVGALNGDEESNVSSNWKQNNVQVNRCEGERTHEDAIQSQQRKCCKSGWVSWIRNVVEFGTHVAPANPSLKSQEERVLQPPLLSIIKTNTNYKAYKA